MKSGMNLHRNLASVVATSALMLLSGCAATYWFHTPGAPTASPSGMSLSRQLAVVLDSESFKNVGSFDSAPVDLGCGLTAPGRQAYHKRWDQGGGLFGTEPSTVTVYDFICDGHWHAVIVADGAHHHAEELRDVLADRFAKQLKEGALVVDTTHQTSF
jgi:hypothetical protein